MVETAVCSKVVINNDVLFIAIMSGSFVFGPGFVVTFFVSLLVLQSFG